MVRYKAHNLKNLEFGSPDCFSHLACTGFDFAPGIRIVPDIRIAGRRN